MKKMKLSKRDKEKRNKWNIDWQDRNPWFRAYKRSQSRCRYDVASPYYGNVEWDLTVEDLKKIWYRDNAEAMVSPSINRKNTKKGYFSNNIEYMELAENLARKRLPRRRHV